MVLFVFFKIFTWRMPGKTSDLLLAVECRKKDDMTLIMKQQQQKKTANNKL